ncbi:IclR family transcriptional regulator C-terminal domain-containing protein [Streptomyces sp. NPDC044780]|uniref:IclR family transcriptional regulator C-terminal domain-containing protein n=1 Tax=Streptomyces luomodiensis TaxID=3026192 RepID=A0ABY9UXK8_9ACTN|nr:IclR family transcriptional regulator C-terminal domain-containing protein [Streptomyces sp. SCA4-21]WNE97292.1 IclR family transcriptional regulator C-terminal domain-containing protein [Streptomyces sp. SCA4-21]
MATATVTTPLRPESGVGVLDKASMLLGVLEAGPATLATLVSVTGLKRPTVHRLALALERLRLVARDPDGRFALGPRLGDMAVEARHDRLLLAAETVLPELRDRTGASARLYRRRGQLRVCVASAETPAGGESVPVGSAFPMKSGAVAQALLAWDEPELLCEGLRGARFSASVLSGVRRRGWAQSFGGWEPAMATVAAPVRGPGGQVIAAVSLSGPVSRVTRHPGRQYGAKTIDAAVRLAELSGG